MEWGGVGRGGVAVDVRVLADCGCGQHMCTHRNVTKITTKTPPSDPIVRHIFTTFTYISTDLFKHKSKKSVTKLNTKKYNHNQTCNYAFPITRP